MNIGIAYCFLVYFMWGLFPYYFHAINEVGALEILAHRIVWSLACVLIIMAVMRKFSWIRELDRKTILTFLCTSVLIAGNWGIYVYSIVSGQAVEASLGYFINPLLSVALGSIFLKERLRTVQKLAIFIAAIGVAWVTYSSGTIPVIGIGLAMTFGFYGLVRKIAPLGSIEGLSLETAILFPIAVIYLFYLSGTGEMAFASGNSNTDWLLVAAGPLTCLPLLIFAAAVRLVPYSTVGIIQYISPTMVFFIGIYSFGEPFSMDRFIGFLFIWTAVIVFTAESLLFMKKQKKALNDKASK